MHTIVKRTETYVTETNSKENEIAYLESNLLPSVNVPV